MSYSEQAQNLYAFLYGSCQLRLRLDEDYYKFDPIAWKQKMLDDYGMDLSISAIAHDNGKTIVYFSCRDLSLFQRAQLVRLYGKDLGYKAA